MRIAIGLTLLLWGLGWWAAGVELPANPDAPGRDARPWRRTSEGWEVLPALAPPATTGIEGLHPILVALGQAQASAFVLLAWGTATRRSADLA
jgi:hypothetical protein